MSAEKPAPIVDAIAGHQDDASTIEAYSAAKAAPSAVDLEVRRLEKEARSRIEGREECRSFGRQS